MRPCNVPQPAGWRCTRGYHEGGSCALIEVAAERANRPPLADAVQAALATVLAGHDGSIPSRWVLVCETLEQDGTTTVWDTGTPGLSGWESLGMFAYGSKIIEARLIAHTIREEMS